MTIACEGLAQNKGALQPLFGQHWNEITPDLEGTSLDFDWKLYEAMESVGLVQFVVARDEGKIVGYHLCIIQPHPHSCQTTVAQTMFFYLQPRYRTGWNGVKLFQASERAAQKAGAQGMYVGHKADAILAPIFVRLGYHQVETIYAKVLA